MTPLFIALALLLLASVVVIIVLFTTRKTEKYTSNLTFDQKRENLALAFAAFVNSRETAIIGGDADAAKETYNELTKILDTQEPIAGKWTIVWGPALYRLGRVFYDGMMAVVQNKRDPLEYKIIIRGTNPVSLRSWLFEDMFVREMVPWKRVITDDTSPSMSMTWGSVSEGTVIALLGKNKSMTPIGTTPGGIVYMTPENGVPGTGLSIMQFLSSIPLPTKGKINLSITGHSLGGLLATALHLFLVDKRKTWNPKSKFTISSCGFASPTAGDAKFASHLASALKYSSLSIVNRLDTANYVWQDIKGIDSIYVYNPSTWFLPSINLAWEVKIVLLLAYELVKNRGYTQLANTEIVEGTFNILIPEFWAQAIYQHSIPYLNAYDLPMSTFGAFVM